MPKAAVESVMSQLTPIGFHTSPCGYCTSNIRQNKKKIQSNDSPDGKNVASEQIESSQSPTSDAPVESRAAYYARATKLLPTDYQILVDHGWRRSGTLLYKPEMRHSCCPHYTIRLPVGELQIRKDQRSACNRWNKFVLGEHYVKEASKLHPNSRAEKARKRNAFDLEEAIHGAEFSQLPDEPAPDHKFQVTVEPSGYSDEKYELYVNYQTTVHGEPLSKCGKEDFKRFLCTTPVVSGTETVNGKDIACASVHQCYILDGRLIAMGVLDLLPHGVSAVYFMYHQDFEHWSFGKLSALREASFARENGYQFYYMGYYIHSCGKMRYKNDFQPQYFLDLGDMSWAPLDGNAQKSMEEFHFYSPAEQASKINSIDLHENIKNPVLQKTLDDEPDPQLRAALMISHMEQERNFEGISLFNMDFVGMLPLSEVQDGIENVPILIPSGQYQAKDLLAWSKSSLNDPTSLKGMIAELLACCGHVVNRNIAIDFR